MTLDPGTIDITDIVDETEELFIKLGTAHVMTAVVAIPGMQWLLTPCLNKIATDVIKKVITILADWSVMQGFFLNTAIRKASQGVDFVVSTKEMKALPPDASDEVYEKAEQNRINKFNNFVVATN